MVPVRNLYYLFLYAWDRFAEGSQAEVGADSGPDLPNLLAKVLALGVRRQLRRGLNRGYMEEVDELSHPRGKFLVQETLKRGGIGSGRAVCLFDELKADTLPNRIVKAALRRLHNAPEIAAELATEMRGLEARLEGVATIPLIPASFSSLQVTRNQGQYRLLLDVCRLVMDLSLPDEGGTGRRFKDILEDEVRMSAVFEQFVRNFFCIEQTRYTVAAETIAWPAVCASADQLGYLPEMLTDVTLRSQERTIIIDAKYYKQTFTQSRFGGTPKVRSSHLYQIQSYLEHSIEHTGAPQAEGLLLYASTDGAEIDLEFQLPRHRLRVCTVDLSAEWQHVHARLLAVAHLPSVSPAYS